MDRQRNSSSGPERKIFCNRTLNLRSIKAVGYDMDYTLIHYRVDKWERRSFSHMRRKLATQGWPIEELRFDPDTVQRGLIIDLELGNILKANQFEVAGRTNPQPGDTVPLAELKPALEQLQAANNAPVCATRGPEGMIVTDPEPTIVPGVQVDAPIDETGAGDSATAGGVLALSAGATLPEAALIGNLVASITIQHLATTGTANPEELPPRLDDWRRQQRESGLP